MKELTFQKELTLKNPIDKKKKKKRMRDLSLLVF